MENKVSYENKIEGFRTGKAPSKSSPKQLLAANYIVEVAPPPAAYYYWRSKKPFSIQDVGNNDNGDCTFASQVLLGQRSQRREGHNTVLIPKDNILKAYYDLTSRLYGGGDTGAYETDALDNWRKQDLTWKDAKGKAYTIDAYTRINHLNINEVKNAIVLSGSHGIKVCINLPAAWQGKMDMVWDIPEGQSPIGEYLPGSWGGHCCAGDTIIHLLDGRNVPISELEGEENIWVYGCLENSQPVPVKASKIVKTKFAHTIQINIDSGVSIRTTPEHLFMMRDGTYRQASSLKSGDRLMPLRRQIHHRGYERLKWYDDGKRQGFTHRMFGLEFGCPKDKIVHHINGNKRDNHPDNLAFITQTEHVQEHKPWLFSEETYKPGWFSTEEGKKYLENRYNKEVNTVPQEENHKVLSIEDGKDEWVYDLMNVSPTHNFAANGVFVHNSMMAEGYDENWLYLPSTWQVPTGKISWRAFSIYADEAYQVIDSINYWKKCVAAELPAVGLDFNKLVADVNSVSSVKIK